MRRTLHSPRLFLAALVAASALALASCGGSDGTSISAEPDSSTTSTNPAVTTTTAVPGPTTTTVPSNVPADTQLVTFGGISLRVPSAWPVYDLSTDPRQCVRADTHAVYLGNQGPDPDCPTRQVGTTETLLMQRLADAAPLDARRATQTTVINGLNAKQDPHPELNGALTVVFPDQNVIVVLTYGADEPLVAQILASAAAA